MGRIGKLLSLVVLLVLIGVPSAAFGQQEERDDLRTYRVDGVSTREDRTAVTRAGAAIEVIGDDYVGVTATPREARRIERHTKSR